MAKLQIDIRERTFFHPTVDTYWRAIVTTRRGNCYSATWAGERPTVETVAEAWKTDRRAFLPFNCTLGDS